MPTYEASRQGYRNLWNAMVVRADKVSAADAIAQKIVATRVRYEAVEQATGVPWFMVGAIHSLEGALAFDRCLHNGERILGTGRKTMLVPQGRGPFATFEESAIDALTMSPHNLDRIVEWPLERILYECERYNGFGYIGKINSPYLWSFSNHYVTGKYVADHDYSPAAVSTQCGAAVIINRLAVHDNVVRARLAMPKPIPVPPPHDIAPPHSEKTPWWRILGAALLAVLRKKG